MTGDRHHRAATGAARGEASAPLVVSAGPQQYFFDEDSAAYAEIDVKRGDAFAVVVVIGSLPSEQFVVDVWHRFAREVWLVATHEDAVYVARAGEPVPCWIAARRCARPSCRASRIAVDALFALPS